MESLISKAFITYSNLGDTLNTATPLPPSQPTPATSAAASGSKRGGTHGAGTGLHGGSTLKMTGT
jgi:hypothetical protein